MSNDFDSRVTGIAALGEPIRRALYRFVVAAGKAVSRDEAAVGAGVPRHTAKFHLDKLEEDGLLDVEFRRPPGRTGPGAGRPSKLYRRSKRELQVSLPERRYDLAGRLMARAITDAARDNVPVADALRAAAEETGRTIGEEAKQRAAAESGSPLDAVSEVLDEYGYEPRPSGACLTLANCPFHALAQDYTELVCGMNLEIVRGLLSGLEQSGLEARLDPAPDRCCVTVCPAAS